MTDSAMDESLRLMERGRMEEALALMRLLFRGQHKQEDRLAYEAMRIAASGVPADRAAFRDVSKPEIMLRWGSLYSWLHGGGGDDLHASVLAKYAQSAAPVEAAMCHYLLGMACYGRRDYAAATDHFRRATELDPGQAEYWDSIWDSLGRCLAARIQSTGGVSRSEGDAIVQQQLHAAESASALEPDNPSYQQHAEMSRSLIARKNAETKGCFIATAAAGTATSWEVLVLSRFRDRVLMRHSIGRALVSSYYMISPSFAGVVVLCRPLRFLCLRTLVRPAAWLARLIMR